MKLKISLSIFLFIFSLVFSLFYDNWPVFSSGPDAETARLILFELRLPRLLAILFVGMSLGVCGFVLQSLLQNPLAEPYTLGISGGASVGISIALLFLLHPLWLSLPLLAGITCLLITALIFILARSLGGFSQRGLILAGVIISFFCSSLSYMAISALAPNDLATAMQWLMGRFGGERDAWWPLPAISFCLVFAYLYLNRQSLEYYHLGEELSKSLIASDKKRLLGLLLVSILCATTVVVAGIIAFVGLIAPHLSFYLCKSVRYKVMLPLTAFYGALLLLLSDIIGRLLFPTTDLPAGGIVAIFGTPFLLYLLIKGPDGTYRRP